MAQQKTFIGLKVSVHRKQPKYSLVSLPISTFKKLRKHSVSLEIGNLAGLQLKLKLVSDQGDEFGIRRFALCIADGITEKSLQRIQVASVPGYFDGMADGALYSAGGGLEGFCHLRVQDLGDGVGVPYGPPGSLAGCSRRNLQRLSANVDDLLLSLSSRNSLLYGFENMIAKQNRKVKREPNEHLRKFSWRYLGLFLL